MATPRKKWFKVADSILREDWDDATLATAVRLMAWLNQRWRRDGIDHDKAGQAVIGSADAMLITNKLRPLVALKSLASLPLVAGWSSASASLDDDKRPTRVTIRWDKYADFQGEVARRSGNGCPSVAPSDSVSDSISNKTPCSPPEGDEGASKKSSRKTRKRPARQDPAGVPERLTDEERERLRAWATEKEPWAVPRLDDFEAACLGYYAVNKPRKTATDWCRAVQNWVRNDRTYAERDGKRHPSQAWAEEQRKKAIREKAKALRAKHGIREPTDPSALGDSWQKEIEF